jgi:N-acetylmuramoyl-L-alanine amidase
MIPTRNPDTLSCLQIRSFRGGALSFLLGVCLCLGTSSLQASAAAPESTDYLKLKHLARQLGMQWTALEEGDACRLQSGATTMTFLTDDRHLTLNGIRVHLGFAIAGNGKEMAISEEDWRHSIKPLLMPQAVGEAPTLSCIFLDPGHGGKDPGAQNAKLGIDEKDLTLDLAQRLQRRLEEAGKTVLLSRNTDTYLTLEERAQLANAAGADLFLSIHINASYKPEVFGVETFVLPPRGHPSTSRAQPDLSDQVQEPGNRSDPWNALLGFYLQRALVDELQVPDRGLKRARFGVLKRSQMPAALLEVGFLSNETEAEKLNREDYRERIIDATMEGLQAYERTLERLHTTTDN